MFAVNSVASHSVSSRQNSKFAAARSSRAGSPRCKAARTAALAGAVLLCITPLRTAFAADVNATFTNTDANNSWIDAHNWTPAVEPNNGNGGNNYLVDVPAAPGAANVNADIVIDGLTVETSAQVNILNNDELAVGSGTSSTVTNNGTITVNSNLGGNVTDLRFTAAGINLLTGTGSVVLAEGTALSAINTGAGATLTVDTLQTIAGTGNINAAMTNNGTIDANKSASALTLQTNAMTNGNIMEATGGGNLNISGITVTNSGTIEATGTNSTVTLTSSATISGGTLSSAAGDAIVSALSSVSNLENGVTITTGSTFNLMNNGQTNVSNTLTNNGRILVNPTAGGNTTILDFSSGSVLAGTGTVVLDSTAANAQIAGSLTQNAGSSITGIGEISAALTNNGTVNANVSAGTMTLLTNPMTNGGTMEATGGGNLAITGITVTNTGTIQATGTGSTVTLGSGAAISGGTLSSSTGGVIVSAASVFTTLENSVTLATGTTFNVINNNQTNVTGTLTNNGTLTVNSNAGGNVTILNFNATGVNLLTGNGSIVLTQPGALSEVSTAVGSTLTVDTQQTIKGNGLITAAMTNNGTIDANVSGGTMTLSATAMSNSNIMEATGGANLAITGDTITNTGTIEATGTGSTLTLGSGAAISGGTLSSSSGGVINSAASVFTTLENGVTISSGTQYKLINNGHNNISNTLTNDGTITINPRAGGNTTDLVFSSGAILAGTGTVVLSSTGTNALIEGTLTQNLGSTISGIGQISATLTNNGVVNSNVALGTLALTAATMNNGNLMEATGGGNLAVNGTAITNTGTIEAVGTGSTVTLGSAAVISGGTLSSSSGGVINAAAGVFTNLENGVTISSGTQYKLANNGQTNISNTLTNNGTITVNFNAGGNVTDLDFSSGSILAGTGTVVLNSTGTNAQILGSLTQNAGSSITGLGQIDATLTNNGVVNANIGIGTMTLQSDPMTNGGTMESHRRRKPRHRRDHHHQYRRRHQSHRQRGRRQ